LTKERDALRDAIQKHRDTIWRVASANHPADADLYAALRQEMT
jgi:hypothetical protein